VTSMEERVQAVIKVKEGIHRISFYLSLGMLSHGNTQANNGYNTAKCVIKVMFGQVC